MITIYKYKLTMSGNIAAKEADETLAIRGFIGFVHAGLDADNNLCVWAKVSTDIRDIVHMRILIRGTGNDCEDAIAHQHLGTVVDGRFVWHIFTKLL